MIIGVSGKKQSGKDTVGEIIQYLTTDIKHSYCFQDFINFEVSMLTKGNRNGHTPFKIKKFADKVKDIVCLMINCTREQLEDEEFKNTELGEHWTRYAYATGSMFVDGNTTMSSITCTKERYEEEYRTNWQTAYKTVLTPRMLLQMVGTQGGRDLIHQDIWVNSVMSEYVPKFMGMDILNTKTARVHKVYRQEESQWIITDVRFPNELKAIEDKGGFVIRIEDSTKKYSEDIHPSETALDNHEFTYVLEHQKDINILVEKVKEILIIENIL